MPYVYRKRRIYRLWEIVGRWVMVGLGLLVLGGFWWWLGNQGLRAIDQKGPVEVAVAPRSPEMAAHEQEVAELEARFDEAVAAGRPVEEALHWLQEAIARQAELNRAGSSDPLRSTQRLQGLQSKLANADARSTAQEIDRHVAAGEAAHRADDLETARAELSSALQLQRAINASSADSALKSFSRESVLERQLSSWEAEPLNREVVAALATAREHVAQEQWAEALTAFQRALEGQSQLNTRYARSGYANVVRLDEIGREITSLNAVGLAAELDQLEASGDTAMAAGDFAAAAGRFEAARQLQLEINSAFARSRFLSSPRVEQLETKRQTALSAGPVAALQESDRQIGAALRERRVRAANDAIAAAHRAIEQVFTDFPKSRQLDGELRLKLAYLYSQRDRIVAIQDGLYERLRPLPGVRERLLMLTEFPQALYAQVMNNNPSRRAGRAFPVDSVSWFDATQCCQRLGWMTGRTVRLPTWDEFRVAVGDAVSGDAVTTESGLSGSREMGAGAANAAGFFDLLGNLAEWLDAPPGNEGGRPSPVGGGSYLDTLAAVRGVPRAEAPRSERSRHVGFRVVMVE